ncbi:hypothetical protein JCM10295v2_004492 [Rhodotorula toruloides]
MSEQYTESDFKSLTVVKLKASSNPGSGEASTTLPPPTTDTTGPASSTDEPDGAGLSGTAEVSAAANAETERSAEEKDEGLKSAPAAADESEDQKREAFAAEAKEEEERRHKRAERFGLQAIQGAGASDESDEAKRKRAERFGLLAAGVEEDVGGAVDKKMGKSLEALSSALGSSRQRKKADATSKLGPSTEKSVPQLAGSKKDAKEAKAEPAAKVAADPELQKRIEEEEAKKRKRAERFGNVTDAQAGKKQKTDEGAVAAA